MTVALIPGRGRTIGHGGEVAPHQEPLGREGDLSEAPGADPGESGQREENRERHDLDEERRDDVERHGQRQQWLQLHRSGNGHVHR